LLRQTDLINRKAGLRITTNPAYNSNCVFYVTVDGANVQKASRPG